MFLLCGVIGLPIAVAAIATLVLYSWLQGLGARRAADRGQRAIDRYRTREGKLPSSLDELVPNDLPSYELRLNLYKLLQFDCLVCWPNGNYPDAMYGGAAERIGDWAYVHE